MITCDFTPSVRPNGGVYVTPEDVFERFEREFPWAAPLTGEQRDKAVSALADRDPAVVPYLLDDAVDGLRFRLEDCVCPIMLLDFDDAGNQAAAVAAVRGAVDWGEEYLHCVAHSSDMWDDFHALKHAVQFGYLGGECDIW